MVSQCPEVSVLIVAAQSTASARDSCRRGSVLPRAWQHRFVDPIGYKPSCGIACNYIESHPINASR